MILEGTIEDLTFYIVDGIGYVRKKSSLKGSRVKKDPKFTRTMQSAQRLKRGSQLASKVYRALPKETQVYALYRQLKSMAILSLKEGKEEAAVLAVLTKYLAAKAKKSKAVVTKVMLLRQKANSWTKPLFGTLRYPKALRRKNKRLPLVQAMQTRVERE